MAKILSFFDDRHEYQVGGEVLPSVSQMLRFISREIYDSVSQYTLDNAADRGKRVHKAAENLDRFGEVEIDTDIQGYVEAYVKFRKEYSPEWTRIEYAAYHPEMEYAGTLDRYGTIRGDKTIVDLKTNATLNLHYVGAQLNGYKILAEANALPVDKLAVLQLKKDGTYKFKEIPIDSAVFMACYTLHKTLVKKGRK